MCAPPTPLLAGGCGHTHGTRTAHDSNTQCDQHALPARLNSTARHMHSGCSCGPTAHTPGMCMRPNMFVLAAPCACCAYAAQQPTRHGAITVSLNLNERRHSSTKQPGPQVRSNAASHQASSLGCEQCMCKKAAPGLLAACTRPWDLGGPMIGCSGSPPLGSRCPLNRHVRTPWAPYRRLQKDAPSKRCSEA